MVEDIDANTGLHLSVPPGRSKSMHIYLDILISKDCIHISLSLIGCNLEVSRLKPVRQIWPSACFYQ